MKNPTIGIKIADGSYFPIMEEGSSKRKRLVLTTVNDNQESVQIDLYKGDGEKLLDAVYVGSLLIENITQGPKEASEIELKLGFSQDGSLNAEAGDPGSGQYESLSISMETLGESSMYETPEFSLDDDIEDLQIDDFDGIEDGLPIPELVEGDVEMEDLQLDDFDTEDQLDDFDGIEDGLPVPELVEGDVEMEDLQLDDFDTKDQLDNLESEEISLDVEMEDLQLDDFDGIEDGLPVPELVEGDDDMEDLQLDDFDTEDQLDDPEGEEISLDDDMEDLQLDDFDNMGSDLDLDDEELSLDDEDFDFDDMEEDVSLEAEDFDMDVDDTELFEESSEDFSEDEFEESANNKLEDEDDYTPGILSESEMVHRKERKGGNPFLIALLVIIAIAAIAGISYLLFRSLQGEDSPNLEATHSTSSGTAQSTGSGADEENVSEVESEVPAVAVPETSEEGTNGDQQLDETTTVPELAVQDSAGIPDTTGVWYKIRWGDTLWGISYSFYDSPKDYKDIVKENKIKNPDIIFAETEIFIPSR